MPSTPDDPGIKHYWGSAAILTRLGYAPQSGHTMRRLIERGLPVYPRRNPLWPLGTPLYSNDALILAWELAQAERFRQSKYGTPTARPRRRTTAEIRCAARVSGPRALDKRVPSAPDCGRPDDPDQDKDAG